MGHPPVLARTAVGVGHTTTDAQRGIRSGRGRRQAPGPTALVTWLALSVAFILASGAAILYPLSVAGGHLARARGYIETLDAANQSLTYTNDGTTLAIQLGEPIPVFRNGQPASFDDLRPGDYVLVKYDSLLKGRALEIQARGRRP